MRFSILTLTALASAALAMPQEIVQRGGGGDNSSGGGDDSTTTYTPCPSGLYNLAECCATDVLGVISLDCSTVPAAPASAAAFKKSCGANQASCCSVNLAGQALLCEKAVGT